MGDTSEEDSEDQPIKKTKKRKIKQRRSTKKVKMQSNDDVVIAGSEDQPKKKTRKRKIKQKRPSKKVKKTNMIKQSNDEISEDEYRELLGEISEWYDGNSSISMLKVLYRDHITDATTLHNASTMRDLLDNLHDSGNLSPTDISILFDTINLTKQFGFKPKNKNLLPNFENVRSLEISKFTSHRKKLVKLGTILIHEDVVTIDGSLNTRRKKYKDSWDLIKDLEHRNIICEENMKIFVERLKKLRLHLAVNVLTEEMGFTFSNLREKSDEEIRNICSNSGQASDEDIPRASSSFTEHSDEDMAIRTYLLSSQQKVCRNVSRFTPATWNPRFHVDIVHMFTDLDLLKESKNKRNQDANPTTLTQVLCIIRSTPACKVLIEGEGGIGKSTLLRYVAYNWATDESDEFFKGKIVFLVNIRDIDKGDTILDTILKQIDLEGFYLETGLHKDTTLIKRFIWNHSHEIVLLLDGLDELKNGSESPISIFKNQKMCKSKVILTSRSENINDFIKDSSIHVKVKGFNIDTIKIYIRKYFAFFEDPLLGESLIKELELDSYPWLRKYHEVHFMCKNPMLLLLVCIMWEESRHLPADKTDLFKEIFRSILNQFIDKEECKEQKISIFEDTPKKFVKAMVLLGKGFYKGLQKNQISIRKRNLRKEGKEKMVTLALKLGFVYKDAPNLRSEFEDIFTTPHKLVVESLVGFYLCKLYQTKELRKSSKSMKKLLKPLDENELEVVRRSEHLHMARVFAVGFLGADAGIFLNHWITNNFSTYRPLVEYLRCVKEEHMSTVEKAVIEHMNLTDLEIKPHVDSICKSLKKFIHYIIPNRQINPNAHFIELMRNINGFQVFHKRYLLSYDLKADNKGIQDIEGFCREMSSEEKGRTLAHILIAVSDQSLILSTISRICVDDDIKYLTTECQKLHFKYDITDCTLSESSTASYIIHMLTNAPKLIKFWNRSITGANMNDVIRECSNRGVRLALHELDIIFDNPSNIDGSSFASVFITSKLNYLGMHNCSLTSAVMNDMLKECASRGVNLELKQLDVSDNNLSNINGSSFVSLITPNLNSLKMYNCSLSGSFVNDVVKECFSRGVKLELQELDISDNNLSSIDGVSFASLFITTNLTNINMCNCNISGIIMNDMTKVSSDKGIKLELERLYVSDNNLSQIDCSLFVSFIAPELKSLVMSKCSISGVIMNDLVRNCSNRGVKLELEELNISDNNFSNIDSYLFAAIFITPKLMSLKMSNCSLSGAIINNIIKECSSREVNFEILTLLQINDNNLSSIDGSLFSSVFFTPGLNYLEMSNCSISGDVMYDIIRECSSREVVLELEELNLSGNNLSNIDGCSFASLFITPTLEKLEMSKCSLSAVIMNDMISECSSAGVRLGLHELNISGNSLKNIDGSSFASLFAITPSLNTLDMSNCSLSGVILNDMIRECSSRELQLGLKWLDISRNNLSNTDYSLFVSLLNITPDMMILKLSNCSLSDIILNDFFRQCCSKGVRLESEGT